MSLLKELFSGARQQQQLIENFTDSNNNSPMNPPLIETMGSRTQTTSISIPSNDNTQQEIVNSNQIIDTTLSQLSNILDGKGSAEQSAEFADNVKKALEDSQDIIFNSRRIKETHEEIKRTHLHNIYKNIGIVILLIFAMYLIVYNRKYLKQIIRALFKLFDQVKEFSQTNISKMRSDIKIMNNALFSQDLYKKFTRPRRFVFN